jgi:hypothetical protein
VTVPSTGPRAAPSPFLAMLDYTIRACVPSRRRSLLVLPAAAAVLFGLLATVGPGDAPENLAQVAGLGIFSLVLPLACLVLGDAVLGAEVRAGTFALTWMSPVPFRSIVLARWLGGWLVALPTLVPAGVVACMVAGVPQAAPAMALALVTGAAGYVALFLLLGVVTRRAAVWSIAVVILVERLVGTAISGVAQFSPMWLARGVFADLGVAQEPLVRSGIPEGWPAVGRLGLVSAVALGLATWQMRRIKLSGSED